MIKETRQFFIPEKKEIVNYFRNHSKNTSSILVAGFYLICNQ